MTRPVASTVTFELPLCPSVNKAFAARHGSHMTIKTAVYHAWTRAVQDEQGQGEALPKLPPGPYGLWLDLPSNMRGDIDNRIKLNSDVLRTLIGKPGYGLGVVEDDAHMDALYVHRQGRTPDRCTITVVTLADWPSYVELRLL